LVPLAGVPLAMSNAVKLCVPVRPPLATSSMERLLADNTDPVVRIRHDVVASRQGLVGRIEVLCESWCLPYRVARSLGDRRAKRNEVNWVCLRHGSQTEEPTEREMEGLQAERDAARAAGG
jgi:hypothetical protein